MTDIIRSVRAELNLGHVAIDCYMLPDGEKRIGLAGASLAIGRSNNYLSRLLDQRSNKLKSLQEVGFTGYLTETDVPLERGTTRSKTISVRDFTKLVTWDAVVNKNTHSIILLASFAEVGLDDTLDRLFKNKSLDLLLSKIVHYSKWTAEEWKEALDANKDDLKDIYAQERFLREQERLFFKRR